MYFIYDTMGHKERPEFGLKIYLEADKNDFRKLEVFLGSFVVFFIEQIFANKPTSSLFNPNTDRVDRIY